MPHSLSVGLFVVLEREREDTKEAESSVAALRRRVSSQHEAIAALDAEIEQYRARVANLRKGPFLSPLHLWFLRSRRPSRPLHFRARDRAENVGRACGACIFRIACLRARFELHHRGRRPGPTSDTIFHQWR